MAKKHTNREICWWFITVHWTDLFPAGDKNNVRCFLTCIQAFCHQNCSLMEVITNKLRKLEQDQMSIYCEIITFQFIMYLLERWRGMEEKWIMSSCSKDKHEWSITPLHYIFTLYILKVNFTLLYHGPDPDRHHCNRECNYYRSWVYWVESRKASEWR